jgi:DNA-binding Lrp family transcriptional regulator
MVKGVLILDYTVQETATKLNISRMTVYKKIDKLTELKKHIKIKNGKKYLTDNGIEIIKLSLENYKEVTPELTVILQRQLEELKIERDNQVKYLQFQIETKDKQLESKDELLKNFQVLLGHEQQAKALLENKLSEIETKKDLSLVEWLKNIFYRSEKI